MHKPHRLLNKALLRVRGLVTCEQKGRLISLEGMDGSGKSTLLNTLFAELSDRDIPFQKVSVIPDGRIRDLVLWDVTFTPLQRMLLYKIESDRTRLKINALMKEPIIVFVERAAPSFIAYQGFGEGLLSEMLKLNSIFDAFPTPDLTLYLDIPVEEIKPRLILGRETQDHFELKDEAFFHRVRKGYLYALPKSRRVAHINAMLPRDEIAAIALERILSLWENTTTLKKDVA